MLLIKGGFNFARLQYYSFIITVNMCWTLALWPCALRNSAQVANWMPSQDGGISPLELFTRSHKVASNLKHLHTLLPSVCPEQHTSIRPYNPKMERESAFRCQFKPITTSWSANLLSVEPNHGLMVSPQYHISHDDYFETTASISNNPPMHSIWKRLSDYTWPNTMNIQGCQTVPTSSSPLKHDHDACTSIGCNTSSDTYQPTDGKSLQILNGRKWGCRCE